MSETNLYERYHRQTILPGFGAEGQQKLLRAKVFVVGAGGLGCPVLQYLTAAGVGTIGIADDDLVALNNLHRQVLYSVNDIGLSKAERAADILRQLNPEITITPHNNRITTQNALALFEHFDIIIDGTDNFAARYMINDACVLLKKSLVYGAISQFEGQVSVFKNQDDDDVNYRDIFPDPPKDGEVPNCAEAGVLGVLPGIVGTMMASETIKIITGIGASLTNQLLTFNALTNQVHQFSISAGRETHSQVPKTSSEFLNIDYDWLCSSSGKDEEIDAETFIRLIEKGNVDVIDVREPHELPTANEFPNIRIPLGQLTNNTNGIEADSVITFCQTGSRSLRAVKILKSIFGESKKIYSLRGGILEWKRRIKHYERKKT
ncbi:MAG TPA: HesA/MoeB/ThiF family protein [Chitinophagaceae bacterium]|jgi:sulfur-carrier protein adenylyltransferase/sulfurtransferase|nr:HesA/MoeB/ThiF family protein [Chitinophagaceae bacterium]